MPNLFNPHLKGMVLCLCVMSFLLFSCKKPSHDFKTWQVYRGDQGSSAYSELDQIHSGNVDQLEVAWEYATGDASDGNRSAIQCNPIKASRFYDIGPGFASGVLNVGSHEFCF